MKQKTQMIFSFFVSLIIVLTFIGCSSDPEIVYINRTVNQTVYVNNTVTVEKICPSCEVEEIKCDPIIIREQNSSYVQKLIRQNKRLESSCNISGLEWKGRYENCNNTLQDIKDLIR